MKIIDSSDPLKRICPVFAIYWIDGIRHHLIVPQRGYGGLIVVTENKSEIIDSSIDGFILRKSGSDRDMLVHWSVSRDDLLDRLINYDTEAMTELERRLREEAPPLAAPMEFPPAPAPQSGWLPPR